MHTLRTFTFRLRERQRESKVLKLGVFRPEQKYEHKVTVNRASKDKEAMTNGACMGAFEVRGRERENERMREGRERGRDMQIDKKREREKV